MDQDFAHQPVMAAEVVELFGPVPPGLVVDATVGGGGHAAALLEAHPHLSLLGIDQDPDAVAAATGALARFRGRATVVRDRFDRLAAVVRSFLDRPGAGVSGVLIDLGVSSPQLDRPERGFSYRTSGPLDMRMDQAGALSAADVVNGYSTAELTRLFMASGEGRLAARIARAIVAGRPHADTAELAEVVASAVPAAARRRGHPARRVFQAIRMEVNAEVPALAAALDGVEAIMGPGGRCCVLSYHSGEDKVVKARFGEWADGGCQCPPGLPCACGAVPVARLLNRRARRATPAEVEANPRAKAARLRAVEWVGAGPDEGRP